MALDCNLFPASSVEARIAHDGRSTSGTAPTSLFPPRQNSFVGTAMSRPAWY
jgi:hypothetical protein